MCGQSGMTAQRLRILGLGLSNVVTKVTKFIFSSLFCAAVGRAPAFRATVGVGDFPL